MGVSAVVRVSRGMSQFPSSEFTSKDSRGKELEMKIGFSLCLLACLASGILACGGWYSGNGKDNNGIRCDCHKCNFEKEACCSYPNGGAVFCSSKSDGCPPGYKTEHPGFAPS